MEKLGLALFCLLLPILIKGANSTTFTLKNNCPYTIWPATLSSSGSLPTTGFELQSGSTLKIQAPPKWSGRFWPRTNCSTDTSSKFSCLSGDCGGGKPECAGTGGAPPASLAEFTLQGHDNKDFYDISLVDGYNVPVSIVPRGVPECNSTRCPADINQICPPELQAKSPDGVILGCKSACLMFGKKEYCCSDDYNDPKVCKPTNYSKIFKGTEMDLDNIECVSISDGIDDEEIHHRVPFSSKLHGGRGSGAGVGVAGNKVAPPSSVHELLECPVYINSMYPPISQGSDKATCRIE